MKQIERMENELRLAGFKLEPVEEIKTDDDYSQAIGYSVYQVCKCFCKQDFSGFSAEIAISILTRLLNGGTLTELTNNPAEWCDISEMSNCAKGTYYQSCRNSSCFSDDGLKTYYDIDADENKVFELDDNGNRTGYSHRKSTEELHRIPLKEFING